MVYDQERVDAHGFRHVPDGIGEIVRAPAELVGIVQGPGNERRPGAEADSLSLKAS